MLRYVASVWNVDDTPQERQSADLRSSILANSQWHSVLHHPGLTVMCAGLRDRSIECYQLPDDGGVILGKLYRRADAAAAAVVLTGLQSNRIVQSGGRHLIDCYYGEYVAFLADRASKRVWVVQCPSAGRPVYRTVIGGMRAYFTELDDVVSHLPIDLSINWEYLAAHSITPVQQSRATGLRSVTSLLAGQCDVIDISGSATKPYWSP